ncbi:F-box/LRR-repeat protein 6-like [Xenia sp. Carnegie-2017]|uniref:F-box/LRR-repeat protein 6-like n=1 Tax=Xenia sp. Carnegie-2017 TaxID=2897299 RepID=UPI001F0465CF|nr:F-box/LRR-repeat protein 6-like [Xenia sp. Carnegie-2017]XP_046845441.1 F-box/LRR-repeat protein 6-like [Xenia sp. Carnegie-2017]
MSELKRKTKKCRNKKYMMGADVTQYNCLTFGQSLRGLPSDDSDCEEYEQFSGNDKRKKGSKYPLAKKKFKSDCSHKLSDLESSLNWSHLIPNEILYKIFLLAVSSGSCVPLLARLSRVCHKWRDVASHSSLWCSIDLSFMSNSSKACDETIYFMKAKKMLNNIKDLSLKGWTKLTNSGLQEISEHCKELVTLDLSRCEKIGSNTILDVAKSCRNLTSVDLSATNVNGATIKKILCDNGSQLEKLVLANNLIGSSVLLAIECHCNQIKILDLSSTSISTFSVERLQVACPNIQELRLSQLSLMPSIVSNKEIVASSGFPQLELLSLATLNKGDGINDNLLLRLLKSSCKLRQLDLRGCEKITHMVFASLPVVALEQLLLSRCKMSWTDLFKIINSKWQESLKELDVSWCKNLSDASLQYLLTGAQNKVFAKLDFSGTAISANGLRIILKKCHSLSELNLTSCRGINRGQKQLHHEDDIKEMKRNLKTAS